MRGTALTPEQNEHVRVLVRKLLERFTQARLAPMIGLTQGAISGFLNRRSGVSKEVAERVAVLMSRSLDDVLALRDPAEPDRYPNRFLALQFARSVGPDGYLPEAIEFVAHMDRHGDDLSAKVWLRMIDFWDEQLRLGNMLPLGPQGRAR